MSRLNLKTIQQLNRPMKYTFEMDVFFFWLSRGFVVQNNCNCFVTRDHPGGQPSSKIVSLLFDCTHHLLELEGGMRPPSEAG